MACDAALTDLLEYMKCEGVRVSAFDATNSTKERRKHIVEVLKLSGLGVKHMFVESICDEDDVRCCCFRLVHSHKCFIFFASSSTVVTSFLTDSFFSF